jgi:uncharacterized protein YbbC (DUF1343 family)/CubicO group peptidase (beta-lactamase class C family)
MKKRHFSYLLVTVSCLLPCAHAEHKGAVNADALARIDDVVQAAIQRGELPGAVVLVLHRGEVVLRKSYGLRSKQPAEAPMTVDTIFDLASLTKPLATATSVMILVERGQLSVADHVAQFLPSFGANGKDKITVEQLLLHTSGLVADNALAEYEGGAAAAYARVDALKPAAEPGTKFVYSDVGYIVLGRIVERLAGMPLDAFVRKHISAPLGMRTCGFHPSAELRERTAPTEQRAGHWLVGEVHDPRAALLGGVAGHAGLFASADDLASYARMLLGGGSYRGQRILSPLTVRLMTTARPVPGGWRAYGWDLQTQFSSNRGELFPCGQSFGHTGFTGTSIWIDPGSDSAVIFLSNRVHVNPHRSINRLRNQVATLAAAAILDVPATEPSRQRANVLTGIDILVHERFQRLRGRRIGLVTNHTGRDSASRTTIDLFHQAEGLQLIALFSPEHGIRGSLDEKVSDGRDAATGLPIYSLYGARTRPTPEMLKGIDTLVYDLQDAGARYYTYISTLGYILEAAKQQGIRVVVLDRPNPIGGRAVAGPVRDPGAESFVAYHRLPVRHGMTVGELALLYNTERHIGADLEILRMDGWRRADLFDRTGLTWVNPSPNLRSLTAALLYPGIGLLETTNLSVGRGTDRPFEWVGAPWLDGRRFAEALAAEDIPGTRFIPLKFTPVSSIYKGEQCGGVQIIIDNWQRFEPLRLGIVFAAVLHRLYPEQWQIDRCGKLLAHQATLDALKNSTPWRRIERLWQEELDRFKAVRQRYLLYPE